jgi:aminopeptidase-like protein
MALDRSIAPDAAAAGLAIHARMGEMFPICRSITGDGLRETLRLVAREVPVEIQETPTGAEVLDWIVPNEWNVRAAWIEGPDGSRVVDLADSNLHVLNYSAPVDAVVSLEELREHVFTHANDPDLVPYRTSYYVERWGFCMSRRQLDALPAGDYRVVVDSSLEPGSVSYAEAVFAGDTTDEVLLTTYACHPSLANDNLSGVATLTELGRTLAAQPSLHYTYRLLWSPGTIGAICWLARNRETVERIRHGLVVSCVGDSGRFTYKRSRRGNAEIDQVVAHVLRRDSANRVLDWFPYGGDERQFCSPGFDLPIGAFSRTPADQFPEYHSSADDLGFVRPEQLGGSFSTLVDVIDVLESNRTYRNASPYGEPQLGRRGLYRGVGGSSSEELALLWVLSLSDGTASLLDIADRSGMRFDEVRAAADRLEAHDLLHPATP